MWVCWIRFCGRPFKTAKVPECCDLSVPGRAEFVPRCFAIVDLDLVSLLRLMDATLLARDCLESADPMLCDHNGDNSLVVACRRGHAGIVSSIMKAIKATDTKVDYKGIESRFVVALESIPLRTV